jgi:predicted nucleic acid-binding protein
VVPVTIEIAVEAGFVRGRTSLTLADAIHLAMARQAGASAFVTNDRRLRSMPELAVIQLADLVA